MGDITITSDDVALTYTDAAHARTHNVFVSEAVSRGELLYQKADGDFALADANVAGAHRVRAIALEDGKANSTISVVTFGVLSGYGLSGMDYDDPVYLSDTAGSPSDVSGSTQVVVGIVWNVPTATSGHKRVLLFDPNTVALD